MNESERPLVEVTLPAPVDVVWQALRDPAELRRWFGWQYDGLDDEIRLLFDELAQVTGAGRTLQWEQGDQITLRPDGRRTVLRLTRAAPASGASWDDIYDDISEGWITFVQQLRFALDRHPGDDRRTVYVTGTAADPDGFPVEAALGLTGVAALSPGSPYDTKAATGDALTGEVWFRTAHQVGITVGQYGDGLLIVGDRPPSAAPPHGGGWLVLTAYGMDDAAFADVQQRWTGWWQAHYPPAGDDAA